MMTTDRRRQLLDRAVLRGLAYEQNDRVVLPMRYGLRVFFRDGEMVARNHLVTMNDELLQACDSWLQHLLDYDHD